MVTVPVHEWFLEGNDTLNEPVNGTVNGTVNDTVNGTVNNLQTPIVLTVRQRKIVEMIEENDRVTAEEMLARSQVSMRTIKRDLAALKKMGVLLRVGSDKTGCWMIARKVW